MILREKTKSLFIIRVNVIKNENSSKNLVKYKIGGTNIQNFKIKRLYLRPLKTLFCRLLKEAAYINGHIIKDMKILKR